jgi:hypothetical protein
MISVSLGSGETRSWFRRAFAKEQVPALAFIYAPPMQPITTAVAVEFFQYGPKPSAEKVGCLRVSREHDAVGYATITIASGRLSVAWQSIQFVMIGLGLVAFVLAGIFYFLRYQLRQRAEIIRSASSKERLDAIALTAEQFRVDVGGLPQTKQSEIVVEQIAI